MQHVAESKRKGYRCVVWSEKAFHVDALQGILCSSDVFRDLDSDEATCMKVSVCRCHTLALLSSFF